jgi:phosphotransferase system HPr (HPr) family protein
VPERRVVVGSKTGLSARPAAMFVQAASKQPVKVTIARAAGGDPVDARSILAVLRLDILGGEEVVLAAEGDGAEQALDELAALVARDLDDESTKPSTNTTPPTSSLGAEKEPSEDQPSESTNEPPAAPPREQVEWLSDAPASKDLLRRWPLALALATRLRRMHEEDPTTSFLVHIDGPWGSGKSTLLNFVRTELGREWLAVDFDAWRQAGVGPPWWALLAALRHNLGRDLGLLKRARLRIAESLARLRRGGAPFAFALTLLLSTASGVFLLLRPHDFTLNATGDAARTVTAVLTAIGTLWAGALVAGRFLLWDSARGARLFEQSNTNPMQDVADHFGWLVVKIGRPVVFFIDDLDRCPESYVVELLDAVQTLIRDAPRWRPKRGKTAVATYFVVAADGAWIRKSYEIAYQTFEQYVAEPGRPLGYLFLDKLFQLRVPVPSIDTPRQNEYLRELLGAPGPKERGADDSEQDERAIRDRLKNSTTETQVLEALRQASPEIRDRVAETAVERLSAPEVEEATEHSLQRFAPLLQPNPRSVKRFVNTYSVLRTVRTLEGIPVPSDPLALWTILETQWPGLADHLRVNPQTIELLGKPAADLESIPENIRMLLCNPAVQRLADFEHGGPLTVDLIRACCGAADT